MVELFVEVIKLIEEALAPFAHEVQAFLLFDTCTSHLHISVFNACVKANIWPHLVPPGMTWFLQPLDTEGFAGYKLRLQRAFQDSRRRHGHGIGDVGRLLACVYIAIREVLATKDWSAAFDRAGFSLGQLGVKEHKLRSLGGCPLAIPCDRPTEQHVQVCFPKNRKCQFASLWRAVDKTDDVAHATASASSSSGVSVATPPPAAGPIALRTRAKTKSAAASSTGCVANGCVSVRLCGCEIRAFTHDARSIAGAHRRPSASSTWRVN